MNLWVMDGFMMATLLNAYRQSEWMGKSIIWLLFGGSVVVWSIMVGKRIELVAMARRSLRFLDAYRRCDAPTDLADSASGDDPARSPVEIIFASSVRILRRLLDQGSREGEAGVTMLDEEDLGLVKGMAERMLAEQMLHVERGMSLLATATTAAPFLGLLGTVWGVMVAFQAMSGRGVVLLSEVAPGISGALATTVVGLFVALPSAIGYNFLTDRVRALQVQMESFADEFMADVVRSYRRRHNPGPPS